MTVFQLSWLLSLFAALGIGYPVLKYWLSQRRAKANAASTKKGAPTPSSDPVVQPFWSELLPQVILCSYLAAVVLLGFFYSYGLHKRSDPGRRAQQGVIKFIVLQLNDVYEIEGVSQGEEGGLARVATLRKQLLAENHGRNVITVLAGDTWSPSVLGDAIVNGAALKGRQMMDVLDAMGLDYATFGNHEFDLKEENFLERLEQSNAKWVSTNVRSCKSGAAFEKGTKKAIASEIRNLVSEDGSIVRVGLIGLTIDDNQRDYSWYLPPASTAVAELKNLQGKVDVVLALTHLNLYQDRCLANKFSNRTDLAKVIMIIGGHEHENVQELRGTDFIPITKADANARTVYVHRIEYSATQHRVLNINSQLVRITKEMPQDPDVQKKVDDWLKDARDGFKTSGFDVDKSLGKSSVPLDGREAYIRNGETELTRLVGRSMAKRGETDFAFYNAGSIRIDEEIPPRDLTQRDVLRVLPFGGLLRKGKITGASLIDLYKKSEKKKGNGMFMQFHGIADWKKIQPNKKYEFTSTDYMIQCKGPVPPSAIPVESVYEAAQPDGDVRHVLMHELDSTHGSAKLTWSTSPRTGCYIRPLGGSEGAACSNYVDIKDATKREDECMSRASSLP